MARRLFWGRLLLIFMAVIGLLLLIYAKNVVQVFLLAIVTAYLLDPLVRFLEKKNCPRIWGIALIYLLVLGLLIGAGMWAIPAVNRQSGLLMQALPEYIVKIKSEAVKWQLFYRHLQLPEEWYGFLHNWLTEAENTAWQFVRSFLNGIIPTLAGSFIWFLVPIISFYFLKDKRAWQKYLWQILPLRYQKEEKAFFRELDAVIMGFFKGSVLVGSIVGVLTAGGLWLAGIDFALIFGLIAGLCNIIPYFGPFIGAAPAVLFAFLQEPLKALWAVLVMIVVQQGESHFITPQIMGKKLGLYPTVIMFALLVGGKIFGFWGLVLAVPLSGVLKIIGKYLICQAIYTRD